MEWLSFKTVADNLDSSIQIVKESSNHYELAIYNGPHTFECHLLKDDGADQIDFETNYLPNANKALESRASDGKIVMHQDAFADNILPDGKVLYLKIHGMKAVVPAATLDIDGVTIIPTEHEFKFTIPYTEVYLQGAEIFVDILAQTDMGVKHPVYGMVEQYGYNVCMGKIIYKREARYAARIPMGMEVSAVCKNVELTDQEMGVNFILHEIRDA